MRFPRSAEVLPQVEPKDDPQVESFRMYARERREAASEERRTAACHSSACGRYVEAIRA